MRPATLGRALRLALPLGLAVAGLTLAWQLFGWNPTNPGNDTWTYLAAGERLNDGHALYAIGPGDRPVALSPPQWTVPLLSPPPIAVAWRVLAPFGDRARILWALACLAAAAGALWALRHRRWVLALLAAPVALAALAGNASALILAALVAAWRFRDRPWIVAILVVGSAAVKVTPAALVLWIIVTRRWRALGAIVVVGFAALAVSVVGAGAGAWFDWMESVPGSAPTGEALASLTGLPTWLVAAVGLATIPMVWLVTRSDRATFAASVGVAALTTPAFYGQSLSLLLAAAAPWAWPTLSVTPPVRADASADAGLARRPADPRRL